MTGYWVDLLAFDGLIVSENWDKFLIILLGQLSIFPEWILMMGWEVRET
jgi:hypothetical protein